MAAAPPDGDGPPPDVIVGGSQSGRLVTASDRIRGWQVLWWPITQDIYTDVTPTVGREAALLIASLLDEPAADPVTQSENADVSALLAQEAENGPEGIDYGK